MFIATAQAQVIQRPMEPPLGGGRPLPNPQGPDGLPSGGTTLKPNLEGSLPTPKPAPQVQKPVHVAPPAPARAGPPDSGGTSDCECYRTEFVDTIGRDGRLTRQHVMRSTGTKSLACCRR